MARFVQTAENGKAVKLPSRADQHSQRQRSAQGFPSDALTQAMTAPVGRCTSWPSSLESVAVVAAAMLLASQ